MRCQHQPHWFDALQSAAELATVPAGLDSAARLAARSVLATSTAREWLQRGELTRAQVHKLLTATLLTLVDQVFPDA